MGFEYVEGDEVTNNKHLAEAIDMTREGSAQVGATDYDQGEFSNRDSTFFVAIEALEKIDSAPEESQKEINRVLDMLRAAENAPNDERARVMGEAHGILQDIWVPPTE